MFSEVQMTVLTISLGAGEGSLQRHRSRLGEKRPQREIHKGTQSNRPRRTGNTKGYQAQLKPFAFANGELIRSAEQ